MSDHLLAVEDPRLADLSRIKDVTQTRLKELVKASKAFIENQSEENSEKLKTAISNTQKPMPYDRSTTY